MAERKFWKAIWTIICIVSVGVVAMSQISATDAISNIESWLNFFGIDTVGINFSGIDTTAFILSLITIVISFFGLVYSVLKKPRVKSTIKIEHSDTDIIYYQESYSVPKDMWQYSMPHVDGLQWRLCRIYIHNSSSEKINNIEVQININQERLRNEGSLHLLYQHDKDKPHNFSVNLKSGQKMFFNVVMFERLPGTSYINYYIPVAEDNVHTKFPVDDKDYKIKIEITGDSIQKIEKNFYFGMRNKDNTFNKIWLWSTD